MGLKKVLGLMYRNLHRALKIRHEVEINCDQLAHCMVNTFGADNRGLAVSCLDMVGLHKAGAKLGTLTCWKVKYLT